MMLCVKFRMCAVCAEVLPGPEAAARAAAAASNKKRPVAEAAITKAVQDALHLLGALKMVLPLLSGDHHISHEVSINWSQSASPHRRRGGGVNIGWHCKLLSICTALILDHHHSWLVMHNSSQAAQQKVQIHAGQMTSCTV